MVLKLRGFRGQRITATTNRNHRQQQQEDKTNDDSDPRDPQANNDSDGNHVSEERMDRTLSLRSNLSVDERSRNTATIEETPARLLRDDNGDLSAANTHLNKEALCLSPPMMITHMDANSDAVHAESCNDEAMGYCKIKTRLRSKLLKSKISHLRRAEENYAKSRETIDCGISNINSVSTLQRFPSRIVSAKSESSTMKTPKITNAKQRGFPSVEPCGVEKKPRAESDGPEDQSLVNDQFTRESALQDKSKDYLTQLVLHGCDHGTPTTEEVQLRSDTATEVATVDSCSVETYDSLSTAELISQVKECCWRWSRMRKYRANASVGLDDDESPDPSE